MKREKTKAVLFDLDGTLLKTYDDFAISMNRAFEKCGFPTHPHDYYLRFFGAGIREIFEAVLPDFKDRARFEEVLNVYEEDYLTNCTVRTARYPKMSETLSVLRDSAVRCGIITNKTENVSRMQIEHFYPDTAFEFIWGGTGERPLKPEAAAGREACLKLGLSPSEIMYVGDSETDMIFAKRAGFFALGAEWGYRGREKLINSGADAVIDSAPEIIEYI